MAEYQTGKGWTDDLYFNGQPVALVRNGSRYYHDHLGRPGLVANSGPGGRTTAPSTATC